MIAEFGTGQVFWSLLWFSLFLILIWIVFYAAADIIRSDDLSGAGKALWILVIIVVPYLGILIYLVARGSTMRAPQVPVPAPDLILPDYP